LSNLSLYLASVLIWGSTWLVINYQLGVVAPEVSVAYRFFLAAFILFIWSLFRGLGLSFGFKAHCRFLLLGLLLFSFNYVLAYSAQEYIPSALNAVVFSTMMWMNVLNAHLFFGTKIRPRVYAGAALGMLGLLVLFWPGVSDISLTDRTFVGVGISLAGAFLASLGNMVSNQAQIEDLPIVQSNAWGMFYGAVITATAAYLLDVPFNFDFSAEYILSMGFLVIFGSIVAFGCYLKLLGRIGPQRAGYTTVMIPVVAVLLSVLFEGLALDANIVLGFVLVMAGNLIILAKQDRAKSAT
jgi:drug/metabolite transporter (DMT)-like permease